MITVDSKKKKGTGTKMEENLQGGREKPSRRGKQNSKKSR